MSQIEESLKKLSVNHTDQTVTGEMSLIQEEVVSNDNYVLAVCGTQW